MFQIIRKTFFLYVLLIFATVLQAIMMKHFRSFPDLILLLVVFAAIFRNMSEGILFALVAGILRGSLSAGTLQVDIILFPVVALFSSILSRMFFRHNIFVQVLVTFSSLLLVLVVHMLYLNAAYQGDAYIPMVIRNNLTPIIVTAVFAPVFFAFLSLLGQKEI